VVTAQASVDARRAGYALWWIVRLAACMGAAAPNMPPGHLGLCAGNRQKCIRVATMGKFLGAAVG
jgi:hypothetical protein